MVFLRSAQSGHALGIGRHGIEENFQVELAFIPLPVGGHDRKSAGQGLHQQRLRGIGSNGLDLDGDARRHLVQRLVENHITRLDVQESLEKSLLRPQRD